MTTREPLNPILGIQDGISGTSVLFVCAGNTCRSVMAEYITNWMYRGRIQAESAGLRVVPTETPENAAAALRWLDSDIDASKHVPREISSVNIESYDVVVAMDKDVGKELRQHFGTSIRQLRVWNIPDPYDNDLTEYKRCTAKVQDEVVAFLRDSGLTTR